MIQITMNWHLCSEELPEVDGRYLVTARSAFTKSLYIFTDVSYTTGEKGGFNTTRNADDDWNAEHRFKDVYAWAEIDSLSAKLLEGAE